MRLLLTTCSLSTWTIKQNIKMKIKDNTEYKVNVHYLKNRTGDSLKIKLFIVQCPSQKWSDKDSIASPVQALSFSCH